MKGRMMSNQEQPIPKGYMKNASGALVPEAKVKPIDKLRTMVTTSLCEEAKKLNAHMAGVKLESMRMIDEFVEQSLKEYGVAQGGKKGNITLVSFDGRYKVVRQMAETIVFDERLQAAKALIDECIHVWAKGSNANIKVLVNDAFQVDREGKISTGRVLGLRRLDIKDETWTRAMAAISDSMNVASTKPYVRFYERDERTGEYMPISLDVAAL
jgi:Protein of unknown function (DUF3164)